MPKPVATIPARGSGKKYKQCCSGKGSAADLAPAIAQRIALQARRPTELLCERITRPSCWKSRPRCRKPRLDAASNLVVDLIHARKLDEAEQAARDLLARFPEVHDGYDRLGMVHEARGQFREAADCYRKVIELARANPEDYDAGLVDSFLELVVKLEACVAEAERAVNDVDRTR
jgi:tetratricopeptide (TPR) repeat protein